jgi:hypothetical protein
MPAMSPPLTPLSTPNLSPEPPQQVAVVRGSRGGVPCETVDQHYGNQGMATPLQSAPVDLGLWGDLLSQPQVRGIVLGLVSRISPDSRQYSCVSLCV